MPRINLLPADLVSRGQWPKVGATGAVLVLALTYFIGTSAYYETQQWKQTHRLLALQAEQTALNGQLEPLRAQAIAAQKDALRFQSLQIILQRKNGWSEAFGEFSRRMPRGVWLTALSSVRVEGVRKFVLRGESLSQSKMAEFLDDLNQSRLFTGASVNFSEIQRDVKPEVYRFELSVPIPEIAAASGGSSG